MSAGDQNYSRAAQFKCLSDPAVPLSVWIVPIVTITAARPFMGFPLVRAIISGFGQGGAGRGDLTPKGLRPAAPKAAASANFRPFIHFGASGSQFRRGGDHR